MWLRIDIAEPGRARAVGMIVIESLIGLAAIPGGLGLIRDGLGMDRGWIDHTLLPGWEIPGLLLVVVIGGGMLSAALISLRSPRLAAPAGLVMGVVLASWLAIETLLIGWHGGPQWLLDAVCGGLAVALIVLAAPQLAVSWGGRSEPGPTPGG